MQDNITPLTYELNSLSFNPQSKFTYPRSVPRRQRSKSTSNTPGTRIVKPSQQAFHSTGLLSKKNKIIKEIAPETPIKQRQTIPFRNFGETPKTTPNLPVSTGNQTPKSFKTQKLHFRSPHADSPTTSKRIQLEGSLSFKKSITIDESPSKMGISPSQPPSLRLNYTPSSPIIHRTTRTPKAPTVHSPFFENIRKDRKIKHTQSNPITFPMFISRHRITISRDFFRALDGEQPFLAEFLKNYENGQDDNDYFETKFELQGRLGHGEFADAYHVLFFDDMLEYAVKKTRQPFLGYKDCISKLEEVKMLLHLGSHPHCVSLKQSWIQFGYLHMQMELCNKGNLMSYLEEYCVDGPLTELQIWRIMGDILRGLNHIHGEGIVHLDIKPANIFISEAGTLKIGDFGLAAFAPIVNYTNQEKDDREGDRTYLAPEVLSGPTASASLYSFGLIVLEIAANIILPENGQIWQQMREGNLSGIEFGNNSQMLVDFIKPMLNQHPNLRPSARDLLKHPKFRLI